MSCLARHSGLQQASRLWILQQLEQTTNVERWKRGFAISLPGNSRLVIRPGGRSSPGRPRHALFNQPHHKQMTTIAVQQPAAIDALFHFLHSRSLLSCTTSHLPFCTYQFLYDFRALIIHLGETRLISRIALVHFTIHRLEPAALIPVGAAIGPRATNHERVDRAKWTA